MPFDRSGSDLTAHALRALAVWKDPVRSPSLSLEKAGEKEKEKEKERGIPFNRLETAIQRGIAFLARTQREDGSWSPLWFGNQDHPREENPVYGTARVLLAYRDLHQLASHPAQRGLAWLVDHQNTDGGWGGWPTAPHPPRSCVEETALAVEALAAGADSPHCAAALESGVLWLMDAVERNSHRECSPIGFYFAKLWYYERLYPLIFTVAALGQAVHQHKLLPRAEAQPAECVPASRAFA
jgi:squalene-hopene/tetraprenyl-beta-curcumene cyclase